jgi:glycyl-radical enzyme activating protein family
MIKGTYFNVQRYCIHDGDGIRTTVFLKGCPLKCMWCHNPESQKKDVQLMLFSSKCTSCDRCLSACVSGARSIDVSTDEPILAIDRAKCTMCGNCLSACPNSANEMCGKEATPEEIFKIVKRDRIFYETSGGGMTISGGEPSYQSEFTLALLRMAKADGISSAVETCGAGNPDFFKEAHALGATFLYDIKGVDPALHKRLTGADNRIIFENLSMLFDLNADVIIRLPLIPGVNDSENDISLICSFLNRRSPKFRYAEIMPYHNLGVSKEESLGNSPALSGISTANDETIDRWLAQFAQHNCKISVSR